MKPTQEQLNDPKWWDKNAPEGYDFCFYDETCNRYWFYNKTKVYPTQSKLLAKRPIKPAFVPEVGVECEVIPKNLLLEDSGPYYVMPIAIKNNEVWLKGTNCIFNTILTINEHEFRPKKSKRELFVDTGLLVSDCRKDDHVAIGIFQDMYDSGLFCLKETDK